MNFKSLKYIAAIERYGSISKAAEKLFVSQPYLSKVVQEIEEEYQITIFSRGKNGITLTDSGRVFIDMSSQLLDHVEQFNMIFREDLAEIMRLRISTVTTSYTMDAYLQLLARYPDQRFRFHYKESSNYEVINDIYTNAADVGVVIITQDNWNMVEQLLKLRRIDFQKILDMETYIVVREGHPLDVKKEKLTLEELYDYNFVMYAAHNDFGIKSIENVYSQSSLEGIMDWNRIRQITYVYSRASLHNLLTQADAVALGSRETREQNRQFHIVSIPFPFPNPCTVTTPVSYLCCIHLKDKKMSALAREYMKILTSTYSQCV